jgi:HAD superfamily hydrolase (TIGR01450 family)
MKKPAAKNLARLRAARGFVFDMDGTLVLGDRRNKGLQPLPGAVELLTHLHEKGVPYVVLTNGTTRPPAAYGATLRALGFPLRDEEVFTPGSVAADYLARTGFRRVMILGGDGVRIPLEAAGLTVVRPQPGAQADAVFVGWYREFTMEDIEAACHVIWKGAKLFVASMSLFFATAHGRALGTSRLISAAITSVTGAKPTVLGKPSLEALRSVARALGAKTAQIAVAGDDPSLEVPMAHRGKALAIAVSTGIGSDADFARAPAARRPHITVRDARQLLALYRG